jgi:hypothetical protein
MGLRFSHSYIQIGWTRDGIGFCRTLLLAKSGQLASAMKAMTEKVRVSPAPQLSRGM